MTENALGSGMVLSIVIPAFNESKTIERIIDAVARADTFAMSKQIIVIDDGSSDGTASAARSAVSRLSPEDSGEVIVQPVNGGKTTALIRGFAASRGDYVIVQDADLEYDPDDIRHLLRPILTNRADLVVGSRFIGGHPRRVVYLANAIGNRFMSALFSLLSGMRLTDVHCCYIMLPGDVARWIAPNLHSRRWGFNPEICALIADWRTDYRVVEVGISYYGRSKAEGKKVRFRDGLTATLEIIRYNLRRRQPSPGFSSE